MIDDPLEQMILYVDIQSMNFLKALMLLAVVVLSASDGVCDGIDVTNTSVGTPRRRHGHCPDQFRYFVEQFVEIY